MNTQNNFLSLMNSGGPIMWVIFSVACCAMIMLVWEAIRVTRLIKYARLDYQQLRKFDQHIPAVAGSRSPVTQLLTAINWSDAQSKDDVAQEINIHLEDITPSISGTLSSIAILATLLPMLGLLGTVTGMINVFEVIAMNGSGKADLMADGISQALLTTASGLIIAIPVIFLHHILSGRITLLMSITRQAIHVAMQRDVDSMSEVCLHGH